MVIFENHNKITWIHLSHWRNHPEIGCSSGEGIIIVALVYVDLPKKIFTDTKSNEEPDSEILGTSSNSWLLTNNSNWSESWNWCIHHLQLLNQCTNILMEMIDQCKYIQDYQDEDSLV